jgi:hypothetical protein
MSMMEMRSLSILLLQADNLDDFLGQLFLDQLYDFHNGSLSGENPKVAREYSSIG